MNNSVAVLPLHSGGNPSPNPQPQECSEMIQLHSHVTGAAIINFESAPGSVLSHPRTLLWSRGKSRFSGVYYTGGAARLGVTSRNTLIAVLTLSACE